MLEKERLRIITIVALTCALRPQMIKKQFQTFKKINCVKKSERLNLQITKMN